MVAHPRIGDCGKELLKPLFERGTPLGRIEIVAGAFALPQNIDQGPRLGETACESARALMDLSVSRPIPLANGILTVENDAQAWTRARVSELNKGGGAAEAVLSVIRIRRRVQEA